MPRFELVTEYTPRGDQPRAIGELTEAIARGDKHQVLLGATGTGKTFTMANVIARTGKPALVMAHNKTLAAQLYGEFRELFPNNAVEYFVSYYDYYQPEAYVPSSDTYIEKDAQINDEIDRMRHSATHSLLTRNDVIIVASVSCIYGLGTAEAYNGMLQSIEVGKEYLRDRFLRGLVDIQYERNDLDFHRGTFRVRGDVVEVFPAYEEEKALRIEFFGDTVEAIFEVDPLRGHKLQPLEKVAIFPNSHYVTAPDRRAQAVRSIQEELRERLSELNAQGKLLEAQRLEQRTMFDLEMIEQMGYCNGIENYSRHLSGRKAGEPPPCLIDYFPSDFLLFVDESHQTVPQVGAMYRGDRSRKETLVDFGFRLPSALDNRPLKFQEWEKTIRQAVYVSATPSEYELQKAEGVVVEQIIRPTGLLDPVVEVRPVGSQVDDLLGEIRTVAERKGRVLVTTLTKRMAEDLTEYYTDVGVRVRYLHSDIDTLERIAIIRSLRKGEFDVLVGINLLREGLDIPEVELVAILDADKEGFLRSSVSLIQTIGRTTRNLEGRVIMYADTMTDSLKLALSETDRRRAIQQAHNVEHGITPESVKKAILELGPMVDGDYSTVPVDETPVERSEIPREIARLSEEMRAAAEALEFERAAQLRDRIHALQDADLGLYPSPRTGLSGGAPRGRAAIADVRRLRANEPAEVKRMTTVSVLVTALLVSLALAATALVEQNRHAGRLDERRMAATVKALYDLGPAAQGTPGKDAVRSEIVRRLKEVAPRVLELPFQGAYVAGQPVPLVNVLASFRPAATKRVLLMAHWDTRLWAEKDPDPAKHQTPIPGADDGFSGVAVLLEVAGALKAHPPPDDLGVDLAFVDGEEGPEGHIDMYFQGARRLADTWFDTGLHVPQAGVLVDMVGHKGLRITRESNSNEKARGVLDEIFQVAAAQKAKSFADRPGPNVLDDHIPFLARDLPVVDLIDFDYPYWHTTQDTLDKLDPAAMVEVGQVILGWIDHRAG